MPEIKASPRNRLLGAFADVARNVNDFAAKPFGYDNPPVAMMAGLLGLPAVANTLNELSYGGALGTGSGMTWKPKADTVDAAMTLLPLGATAGKAAIDGGVALAKKAAPAIERAVPRVMERGGLSSQLLRDLSQNTVSPATVWHGSPHKFDKFDSSKIGTGEGAQAYGHGLYLAETPEVAGEYARMKLTGPANVAHVGKKRGPDGAMESLKLVYPGMPKVWYDSAIKQADEAGHLYKVDLQDDAIAKMLDWDKPLSQQHPDVQKAVAPIYRKYVSPDVQTPVFRNGEVVPVNDKDFSILQSIASSGYDNVLANAQKSFAEASAKLPAGHPVLRAKQSTLDRISALAGQDVRQDVVNRGLKMSEVTGGDLVKGMGNDASASQALLGNGIPGIRYLDGGSRGTGAGTSNFVVFPGNEGLLTILERNGQPMGLLGR